MTTDTIRPTRLTWCLTSPGWADEKCTDEHDHYDVAVDEETGKGLYRLDPPGTTYLLPDGGTLRLTKYEDEPFVDPPIEDQIIPQYNYWSEQGGAASVHSTQLRDNELWDGVNLVPGVVRTVMPAPERPAVGSLFVRPNGESWRLKAWDIDWSKDPYDGAHDLARWQVTYPSGTSGYGGHVLPEDARLVWTP